MSRNVLITIEYDGSAFRGWQVQRTPADGALGDGAPAERVRTVQGVLGAALSRVCGEEISLNGTSRTDAGVHALGQAASFKGGFGIPADRIPIAVNNLLDDVRVLSAADVPAGFHARFDAKSKTYLYRIVSPAGSREPNPLACKICSSLGTDLFHTDLFMRNYFYILNERPDECKIEQAAKYLVGTYDFAAFRTKGGAGSGGDTVRTVTDISVCGRDGTDTKGSPIRETEIRVTGKSFMYNMVRIIVGTLVEAGLGSRAPEEIAKVLDSKDRAMAGHTAPAAGLYLERVYFD